MLCQICNVNQATIHIQEIVNGEKKTMHICPQCAEMKALDDPMLEGFNLTEMLYNLTHGGEITGEGHKEHPKESGEKKSAESAGEQAPVCSYCNWTLEKLKKTGRMGCPKCYTAFSEIIGNMLLNMHRGNTHQGKAPAGSDSSVLDLSRKFKNRTAMKQELELLQKNLSESIVREEYELAAELRDKINALKKELSSPAPEEEPIHE